jgi:hypothetical protein
LEHKWGRDVFNFGLSSTGASLAARSIVLPRLIYTNEFYDGYWMRYWFLPAVDTPDTPFEKGLLLPPLMGHFPRGVACEPDEPL